MHFEIHAKEIAIKISEIFKRFVTDFLGRRFIQNKSYIFVKWGSLQILLFTQTRKNQTLVKKVTLG